MQWLWWFIGAIGLGVIEIFTLDLTFAMLAGGALVAGGVALFGVPVWVPPVVFALVSSLLFLLLRPHLITLLGKKSPLIEMNSDALVGNSARALVEISEIAGRIKLNGEVWTARIVNDAAVISEGSEVTVVAIKGATAIVAPDKE